MLRCASLILCVSFLLLPATQAQTVKWSFPTATTAQAPTLYPDAEKPIGVITAMGTEVLLLDGKGQPVWTATLPAAITQPLAVADVDGKGDPETMAVLANGTLVCLDSLGKTRWTTDLQARKQGLQMPAVSDVHPSPGLETVVNRLDGWVFCLAADGRVLWRFFGDRFRAGIPAIGDADGDGFAEILYGTDNGNLYCLDGFGSVKWRFTDDTMPYGRAGVNLADLEHNGRVQVLFTRSNAGNNTCLTALDGRTGKLLWRVKDEMQSYVALAAADMDGDGALEVVHGDKGNFVYCTDPDGSERWRRELAGRGIFSPPTIGDVNGDNHPEILVGVRDSDPATGASHFLVNDDGTRITPLKLGGSGQIATAMGDLDGDGVLEAIVCVPKAVQCLSWGGKGVVMWPSLRGDSALTGRGNVKPGVPAAAPAKAVQGMRLDIDNLLVGDNEVRAVWNTPAPEKACLEVAVRRVDALSEIRIIPASPGATEASLAFRIPTGGMTVLSARLVASGTPEPLAGFEGGLPTVSADECSLDTVSKACENAIAAAKAHVSGGLELGLTRLTTHRDQVRKHGDKDASDPALAEEASALRREAKSLSGRAGALAEFWTEGNSGSFVCWQDENPWDIFSPDVVPGKLQAAPPIAITAFGDEFEDAALNLLNIADRPVDVRCTFSKPKFGGGAPDKDPDPAKHVTLRRGVMVSAPNGGQVLDALPELDLSRTITLSPLEASQLWLSVDTHGLEAGMHTLTLYLGSLEENCTLREVPVTIEVLPVRLPEGVYAQMNWVGTDIAETSDQQLKDMLDHGISVAYGPHLPVVSVDAMGGAAGAPNWTGFDKSLDRLPKWFQITFMSPPGLQWPDGKAPAADSPEANQGFATAVRTLAAHLAEKGWNYDRWVFYPYDEPWLTGQTIIPDLRKFCERVKAVDPKIRNYADPTGLMRVQYVAVFKDLIDVWQPEINVLKRDPELLHWFQQNAKTLWAYEATDPGKNLLPLGYYRAHAWTAWKLGLKGAGFWCYKYHDTWWPLETPDWSVVYQTGDQVTPSRRWEACRDGQEDYRALYALRAEAEKARTAGKTAAADHAMAAISEMVDSVVGWQVKNIDEITRQTRDYEIDFNLLKQNRARIAAEIAALQAEDAK